MDARLQKAEKSAYLRQIYTNNKEEAQAFSFVLIISRGYMHLSVLSLLFLSLSLIAGASQVEDATNYKSGLEKIKAIMLDPQEGITADYQENPDDYAQVRNIEQDLNTDEIVKFFGCSTSMCETYLKEALLHPFSSQAKERMLQRQHIIRMLVENPELKAEVDELIMQAKEKEARAIKLLSQQFMNTACGEGFKNMEASKGSVLGPLIRFFITNETYNTLGSVKNVVWAAAVLGLNATAFAAIPFVENEQKARLAKIGFGMLFLTVPTSFFVHQDYSTALEKRSTVHGVHALISIAERLQTLSKKHSLTQQFPVNNAKKMAEKEKLIKDLKHSRYKNQHAYVFKFPAVHTFLYSLYEKEKYLAQLFASIGELDALNAVATKILEHKDKSDSLCFSEVIEGEKVIIEAKDFWNIQVSYPVVNSITIDNNIVLTGPNAGGKSTAMRALLQNIIFTQFAGFAVAKEFKTSFFDIIHSYLNIADDLKNGMSRFASEIKRAQEVKGIERSLEQTHKKFFCIFDELFGGTSERDGKNCAYEYFKRLRSPHMIWLYATHFDKLKALGKDKDSNCVNYKIDPAVQDQDGNLKYPYTLSRGFNTQGVAFDMAKKAGLFD